MTSLIELIPDVCICGNFIGRLQQQLEDELERLGGGAYFHTAIHNVFQVNGGYYPRLCCMGQCVKAQVYIPNTKIDTVYIDNSRKIETVKPVHVFKPRFPPLEYPYMGDK